MRFPMVGAGLGSGCWMVGGRFCMGLVWVGFPTVEDTWTNWTRRMCVGRLRRLLRGDCEEAQPTDGEWLSLPLGHRADEQRCVVSALRVIRGRFSGTGETRATKLPKPSAAVFAQARLATNCRARFSASGGRLALSVDFPLRGAADVPCRRWARGGGGLSGTTGTAGTSRTQRGGRRR